MKNNIIFKYQLKDAWGMERSMIEITEENGLVNNRNQVENEPTNDGIINLDENG